MNSPIKLSELVDALEWESEEYVSRVDRQNGCVVTVERDLLNAFEEGDEDAVRDLPAGDDEAKIARAIAEDSDERFLHPPDKFDFHEYRHMERFIGTVENADVSDQLWRAIKGKGAFRYFKDTASRLGLLKAWFRYRDDAMKEFVVDWAKANNVPYEDDLKERKG